MVAQRKIVTVHRTSSPIPGTAWESMAEPLHPMHQELLRRMTQAPGGAMAIAPGAVSRPARFAAIFYLGLAGWAVPISAIYFVYLML